jgi:hypothetical protein
VAELICLVMLTNALKPQIYQLKTPESCSTLTRISIGSASQDVYEL